MYQISPNSLQIFESWDDTGKAIPKLGRLDVETIRRVIDAYALLEEHTGRLLLLGGTVQSESPASRRTILMQKETAGTVADLNRRMMGDVEKAIERLDKCLS